MSVYFEDRDLARVNRQADVVRRYKQANKHAQVRRNCAKALRLIGVFSAALFACFVVWGGNPSWPLICHP
jgi:hypothetical protein